MKTPAIFSDSQGALHLSSNSYYSTSSKHPASIFFNLKYMMRKDQMKIDHVKSGNHLTDILTKCCKILQDTKYACNRWRTLEDNYSSGAGTGEERNSASLPTSRRKSRIYYQEQWMGSSATTTTTTITSWNVLVTVDAPIVTRQETTAHQTKNKERVAEFG